MKTEITQQKRSTYFDIKVNGKSGRDDKAQKLLVIGNIMDHAARANRKTRIKRNAYEG